MKSWWYTSSIGCTEHIESRLEQYKFEQGIKTLIDPKQSTKETDTATLATLLSAGVTNQIRSTNSFNQTNFSTRKITKNVVLENIIKKSCFLPFYTIEIIHSGVLIFLGVKY